MNKIWYLSTCDTCKRIIKELELKEKNFELIDIKNNNIYKEELETVSEVTGLKYEDIFNKRAQKYTKTNLKQKLVSNEDFKKAILEEYTFLKRPVIQIKNNFFVGNSKKTIEETKLLLSKN